MSKTCLGLDVGYGGLKIAFGHVGAAAPTTLWRPSTAAPIEAMSLGLGGDRPLGDGVLVSIDGKQWAAGVDPNRINYAVFSRERSPSYTSTKDYLALVHAALAMVGAPVIDTLVTGMPVSEQRDFPAKVSALVRRLQAVHQVTPTKQVEVKQVVVVPQPVGAYMDALPTWLGNPIMRQRVTQPDYMVLCLDSGHFSVDWIGFKGGHRIPKSSDSSPLAGHHVITEVIRAIHTQYGRRLSEAQVESAIQRGASHVTVGNELVELRGFVDAAAGGAIEQVLKSVDASLGSAVEQLNAVILAGGGAKLYEPLVRRHYGRVDITISESPSMANARGFWIQAVNVSSSMAA